MRLGPNFTLEEMPCYQSATPAQIERLRETVAEVLQPVRDRWGPVKVSSWGWWSSGCTPRTGSHAHGAVDFYTTQADLYQVFRWGVNELVPRGYVGRWIYEPHVPGVQGAHIHMAPAAAMLEAFGDPYTMAYVETSPDKYEPVSPTAWGGHSGGVDDPIPIEGVTVTVAGFSRTWAWVLLGLTVGAILSRSSAFNVRSS